MTPKELCEKYIVACNDDDALPCAKARKVRTELGDKLAARLGMPGNLPSKSTAEALLVFLREHEKAQTYLDVVCRAYDMSDDYSSEERLLEEVLDAACARLAFDPSKVFAVWSQREHL